MTALSFEMTRPVPEGRASHARELLRHRLVVRLPGGGDLARRGTLSLCVSDTRADIRRFIQDVPASGSRGLYLGYEVGQADSMEFLQQRGLGAAQHFAEKGLDVTTDHAVLVRPRPVKGHRRARRRRPIDLVQADAAGGARENRAAPLPQP